MAYPGHGCMIWRFCALDLSESPIRILAFDIGAAGGGTLREPSFFSATTAN